MPRVYVTRREVFSAAHRLFNPDWNDAKNDEIFGMCNNYYGHGHNYTLEVVVAGEPSPETGYLIDLKILKKIIKENIISKLDHKNLNFDVDFLKDKNPTVENIVVGIWNELKDKIPAGELYSVKIYETENNYAEYKGE
jgi:6-pyruvoyltetrahydropterin/6-carboxytetrahydropterin synthase